MMQMALPGLTTGERSTAPCRHCTGMGDLEATDIFCGAGGSSLGLEFVCCPHCVQVGGNLAVSSPVATMLGHAVVEALA